MPDSNSNKQTPEELSDGSDAAMDSLLKQFAIHSTEAKSDAFLNQIEDQIDQIQESKVVPRSNSADRRKIVVWSVSIAAIVAVFAVISILTTVQPSPTEPIVQSKPLIVKPMEHSDTLALEQVTQKIKKPIEPVVQVPHQTLEPKQNVENFKSPHLAKNGQLEGSAPNFGDVFFGGISLGGDPYVPKEALQPKYQPLSDNLWAIPTKEPVSTFSIDVDTASWSIVRGLLASGYAASQIPDDAVRVEEWINYFNWGYPNPKGPHPFGFTTEVATAPWAEDNLLLKIGIQGKDIQRTDRADANLVFLLDVSGSMQNQGKLALAKKSISILAEELTENDIVTIVVYAGSEGLVLKPTRGSQQKRILAALNALQAGGSTNGGAGIELAYKIAKENYIEGGVNRVMLCTDGDFNVGVTSNESLVDLVKSHAKDGVYLSVCGFGNDNLNDSMLEAITNKGNGNYFFIDSEREARKVFLEDLMGTLVTIAKDVKIQVEFNPSQVASYRLIGYANRMLNAEDFDNDSVDAGEVGAGHSVTALYEIIPVGSKNDSALNESSGLRYQKSIEPKRKIIPSNELALLKLRYKLPDEDQSQPMQQTIMPSDKSWQKASKNFRFASAVAAVGLRLREHESVTNFSFKQAADLGGQAIDSDIFGYKQEFINLIKDLDDRKKMGGINF